MRDVAFCELELTGLVRRGLCGRLALRRPRALIRRSRHQLPALTISLPMVVTMVLSSSRLGTGIAFERESIVGTEAIVFVCLVVLWLRVSASVGVFIGRTRSSVPRLLLRLLLSVTRSILVLLIVAVGGALSDAIVISRLAVLLIVLLVILLLRRACR